MTLDRLRGASAMSCCAGFFMGNSLSYPKDLLIPFVITNLANFLEARLGTVSKSSPPPRC